MSKPAPSRWATIKVRDMVKEGTLRAEDVMDECLEYMSEANVRDMATSNDWFPDFGDECPNCGEDINDCDCDCEEKGEEHEWGPVEYAKFTGNPHRKCKNCDVITLALDDDTVCQKRDADLDVTGACPNECEEDDD